MHKYLILFLSLNLSSAGVLLTNGDFERNFTDGWQVSAPNPTDSVVRDTTYYPDPDYEVQVYTATGGSPVLSQIVDIPTTALEFKADINLYAYDNNADTLCWAAASHF